MAHHTAGCRRAGATPRRRDPGAPRVSRRDMIAALTTLSTFFIIDETNKVHAYHKSFKDWLTGPQKENSEFAIDTLEVECIFATRCLNILKMRGTLDRPARQSIITQSSYRNEEVMAYALRYVMHHLWVWDVAEESNNKNAEGKLALLGRARVLLTNIYCYIAGFSRESGVWV